VVDFYSQNPEFYFKRTFCVDPSSFIDPFLSILPAGASVIDVGCGSGRDLLWMKNRGYRAVGFERSKEMARLAVAGSGCKVIVGDFETYDFSKLSYDAVYSSGGMVHVPHDRFVPLFENIIRCLPATDRYAYISLKSGQGTRTDSRGRVFYLWQDEDLRKIFADHGFRVVSHSYSESLVNSKDDWLGFTLKG
jgi:SAM-dependent methyltransferase